MKTTSADCKKDLAKVVEDVGPIFEERRQKLQELGNNWTDKPVRVGFTYIVV
jgi:hypothetical protein